MTVDYAAMFLLGIFGTFHCLGMCGPIVLSLPSSSGRVTGHLLYHAGRIATYSVIGGIIASVGYWSGSLENANAIDRLTAFQIGLSFLSGGLLAFLGMTRLGFISEPKWMSEGSIERLPFFNRLLGKTMKSNSIWAMFPTGLLFGFLPCGLTYAAFAKVVMASGFFDGMGLVFVFGLGTIPGLLVFGTGASTFARKHRPVFDILSAILMIGMAMSILATGLSAWIGEEQ